MEQKSHPLEGSAENTYLLRWVEDTEIPVAPGIDLIYESKMRMVTRFCIMKEIGGIFFKTGKHWATVTLKPGSLWFAHSSMQHP